MKPQPRRCHRVAHRAAHRSEPCEIVGIVKILKSQDVSDDEVVGEARDGCLRGGLVRIARMRIDHVRLHRVGSRVCRVRVKCASLCVEASEESVSSEDFGGFRKNEKRASHIRTSGIHTEPHDL